MARCQDLHDNWEQEELGVLSKSELKSEGLAYLALMRMVQSFDTNKIIERALSASKKVIRKHTLFTAATCAPSRSQQGRTAASMYGTHLYITRAGADVEASLPFKQVVTRYNDLLGYVEVSRSGRLERIYFELPDACVPGAPLDKPFAEMFDTEREDADKKNMEWVEHMCRLVGKERLHANIRKSYFAFTVNYWDNVCSITFWSQCPHRPPPPPSLIRQWSCCFELRMHSHVHATQAHWRPSDGK